MAGERKAFLAAVAKAPRRMRTLCLVLAHIECRISEPLEMTARRIDIEVRTIIFESLENRRGALTGPFWCPPHVIDALDLMHGLREGRRAGEGAGDLWPRNSNHHGKGGGKKTFLRGAGFRFAQNPPKSRAFAFASGPLLAFRVLCQPSKANKAKPPSAVAPRALPASTACHPRTPRGTAPESRRKRIGH